MEDSSMTWRTSTYSSGNGGNCVEVASATGSVAVRDTKDRDGGTLSIPADAWAKFTSSLKNLALHSNEARPIVDAPFAHKYLDRTSW